VRATPTRTTRNIHLPRQIWIHAEQVIWGKAILKAILKQEVAALVICVKDSFVQIAVASAWAVI